MGNVIQFQHWSVERWRDRTLFLYPVHDAFNYEICQRGRSESCQDWVDHISTKIWATPEVIDELKLLWSLDEQGVFDAI